MKYPDNIFPCVLQKVGPLENTKSLFLYLLDTLPNFVTFTLKLIQGAANETKDLH